jgi:hypothetical protein
MYHNGSRELRDQFDTRRLADRLEMRRLHATFSERDRALIERAAMFFLATADAAGQPDCSYEDGLPGFVRLLANESLSFPVYNNNGPFRSLGNIRSTSGRPPRISSHPAHGGTVDDRFATPPAG